MSSEDRIESLHDAETHIARATEILISVLGLPRAREVADNLVKDYLERPSHDRSGTRRLHLHCSPAGAAAGA